MALQDVRYKLEYGDPDVHLEYQFLIRETAGNIINDTSINYLIGVGEAPAVFRRRATKTDGDLIMAGTELSLEFYATVDQLEEYDELYKGDYKRFKVDYYRRQGASNLLVWQGFVKPENCSREFIEKDKLYRYSITATDLLGDLKKIEFKDSNNNIYRDVQPLIVQTQRALQRIDDNYLFLPFYIQLNTYEDAMDSSLAQVFTDIAVDSRRWEKVSDGLINTNTCYEVLEDMLKPFNCTLTQADAGWRIINYHELSSKTDQIVWDTSTVGFTGDSNLIVDISSYKFLDYGSLEFKQPLRELKTIVKNRTELNGELSNGDFNTASLAIDPWAHNSQPDPNITWDVVSNGGNNEMRLEWDFRGLGFTGQTDASMYFWLVTSPGAAPSENSSFELQFDVRCLARQTYAGAKTLNVRASLYTSGKVGTGDLQELLTDETVSFSDPVYDYTRRKFKWKWNTGITSHYFTITGNFAQQVYGDLRFDNFRLIYNENEETSIQLSYDKLYRTENNGLSLYDSANRTINLSDGQNQEDVGAFRLLTDSSITEGSWYRWNEDASASIQKKYNINILENRSTYANYIRIKILDDSNTLRPYQIWQLDGHYYRIIGYTEVLKKKWREISAELEEIITDPIDSSTYTTVLTSEDGQINDSPVIPPLRLDIPLTGEYNLGFGTI